MNKFIESIRCSVRNFITKVALILNRFSGGRISPNLITIVGLLAHFYIAWLITLGSFKYASLLLIVFGLFDALDGALARVQNKSSKQGMLLDSVTDRLKEVIIYASIAYVFIATNEAYYSVWVVLACGLSIIVSYINAWGEVVTKNIKHTPNKTFRTGFMTYDVRITIIIIGLFTGYIKQAVVFITIFALLTAFERFYIIIKKLQNV